MNEAMNELRIFNYNSAEVRTVLKDGEPWFVLKDVCGVLELSDTNRVAERLDDDELTRIKLVSGGQTREMYAVNEPGLYKVILRSDKPEAKAFQRWVTHEVLPSIRKHGAYLTPEKIEEVLLNPDTIIRLATSLKAERERSAALTAKVEADQPLVLFALSVEASRDSILVREMAKLLRQNGVETGEKRFYKWLRSNGYLIKKSGADYNMPTQLSMELGLFEVRETAIACPDAGVILRRTPKVTGKGQLYFANAHLGRRQAGA